MAVSFIGGGNRITRRKPATCRKSLTTFITYFLYRVRLTMSGIRTHNFWLKRVVAAIFYTELSSVLILHYYNVGE